VFPLGLLPDLPVHERIDVTTARAVPCPFGWIGVAVMLHLDDQVAMQAHRWFAVYKLWLLRLSHVPILLFPFP
jgi:hypothetical protein